MRFATREIILNSLLNLLHTECGDTFKSYKRRAKFASEVSEQPALFLRHLEDDIAYSGEDLPVVTIGAEVLIYSNAGESPDAIPDDGLDECIAAVEAALSTIDQRQTLGESVHRCRIEGAMPINPGDLDGQAIVSIPVKILVPSFD